MITEFWKITGYTDGYHIAVIGTPPSHEELGVAEDDPITHNCDEMGCGSVGPHILARIPLMYPVPQLDWLRPQKEEQQNETR